MDPLAREYPGEGPRAVTLSASLHTAVSSMLHGHSPVSQALLGTFFTWGLTAAGAALVFVFSSGQVSCRDLVLGGRGRALCSELCPLSFPRPLQPLPGGPLVLCVSLPDAQCLGRSEPPPDFSAAQALSGLEQVATCVRFVPVALRPRGVEETLGKSEGAGSVPFSPFLGSSFPPSPTL